MKRVALIMAIIAPLLIAGSVEAALIHAGLGWPDIFSDQTGDYTYTYNAMTKTGLLTSTAVPQTIAFKDGTIVNVDPSKSYWVQFQLDGLGNFVGGHTAGGHTYDLEIYGNIDMNADGDYVDPGDYTGLLVGGDVTAFGWQYDGNGYLQFDFLFDFQAGALSAYYAEASNHGYDYATVEGTSTYAGWDSAHKGKDKVKHDTAPVPEASTLMLFGSGLSGLLFFARKKRLIKF